MALHGDISINGEVLGVWEAVRQSDLVDTEAFHQYQCRVSWAQPRRTATFMLRHRYSDGAAALAAHVLRLAARHEARP